MKKVLVSLLLASLMIFSLVGCSAHLSHYSALMLVTTNKSDEASMSFSSFNGTKVFTLTLKEGGVIKYSAVIESGEATVYIEVGENKTEMFKITSGESINSYYELYDYKGKVYITVESNGKISEGRFDFEVEYN